MPRSLSASLAGAKVGSLMLEEGSEVLSWKEGDEAGSSALALGMPRSSARAPEKSEKPGK